MSFTVFAKSRPIRTAFLLAETAGFNAVCDGLAKWSTESWGGRHSAVALLQSDGTLTEDSWQELIRFDPDHIYSYASLHTALLTQLDKILIPWLITGPTSTRSDVGLEPQTGETVPNSETWEHVHVGVPGLAVPPTEQNLAALQGRPLLLFNFGKKCPPVLRQFVHRNLGSYDQWFDLRSGEPRSLGWLETLLEGKSVERMRVDDISSLCSAMEQIAGTPPGRQNWKRPLSFTAPCELSSIHLPRGFSRGVLNHSYRVVVGSSLQDLVLYWRSCINKGDGAWNAPYRHCLWVPMELIQEESFLVALKCWLYYFTGQGNSNNRTVELTSASLASDKLVPLLNAIRAGTFSMPARSATAPEIEARWRDEHARRGEPTRLIARLNGDNAERLVAVERTQAWELRPPAPVQASMPAGTWAVDVQIERESQGSGLPGQDWWFLPRNSGLGLARHIFRGQVRISRDGLFAVQVGQASSWPSTPTPPRLQLSLPQDNQVVRGLLLSQRETWFDHFDARNKKLQIEPVIIDMEISDAGRKLRGLVELFGGFWHAREYWARAFWREIFYRMSGRGTRSDSKLITRTKSAVEKELEKLTPPIAGIQRTDAAQRIARRMLGLMGERLPGVSMSFSKMEEERSWLEQLQGYERQVQPAREIVYVAGDALVRMHGITPVTHDEFKEGLEELVELGVLEMGAESRCPRCRLQHWLNTDSLRASSTCPGCGSPMPLIAEQPWSYRLNPLVQNCVNGRVLAVWQALEELAHPPGSFFFTPSSELVFAQPISGGMKKELDILCVTDGDLVVGEVKEGELHAADFLQFAAIAHAIHPERAVMCVTEEHFSSKANEWFKQFRQELAAAGIRGELYCLPKY